MIATSRTRLEIQAPAAAPLLLSYHRENRQHLAPWEPVRGEDYLTLGHWQQASAAAQAGFDDGSDYKFVALNKARTDIIGMANFTCVSRGAFQACFLGYSIAHKYQGQGLMQEILTAGLDYVFNEVGLHRVMANYMPDNERSAALLARLGFEREGYAKSYLKIAGSWQDHVLTSKVNPAG
ncbi:ribosomal protein S5-alanine N-acetyltransferase [Shewanella salipaludis]|uniref:Ribosomal protein S5-alanine N-acetyltransferase n=1 Tax=Shewanella salipaludis TaxID=2723052 RepID=A0A972JHM6_9GAMM|nr:ribosomal protein S5-alanine N-acetyltransferase [Shewanella salipaludis]NMH64163.1 ribosomal protein S5-alanine N-acetyltransferase [Shewanella salipaludis]